MATLLVRPTVRVLSKEEKFEKALREIERLYSFKRSAKNINEKYEINRLRKRKWANWWEV